MSVSGPSHHVNRPIPVAVMGTGRWGQVLAKAAAGHPKLQLKAVISGSAGSSSDGLTVYPTWQAAHAGENLQGILLAIPPDRQADLAPEMMEAGLALFLEKPLALQAEKARAVWQAGKAHNFIGVVDHIHLFAPEFSALLQRYETWQSCSKAPLMIETCSGNRGPATNRWSALWDWAPHDLAMTLALTGTEPNTIDARLDRVIEADDTRYETYCLELGFEDGGRAMIRTGNAMDGRVRLFKVTVEDHTLAYEESADRVRCVSEVEPSGITRPLQGKPLQASPRSPLDCALDTFAKRIADSDSASSIEDLEFGLRIVRIIEKAEAKVHGRPC